MILFLFLFFVSAQTQESNIWHCIEPLTSMRPDVEKILGTAVGSSTNPYGATYRTKNDKVHVVYSTGNCDSQNNTGWKVPEFTVVRVDVEPFAPPHISEFKIDKSGYEKRQDPEILHQVYYTDETDGISLTVDSRDGEVTRMSYVPKLKDGYLKCKR